MSTRMAAQRQRAGLSVNDIAQELGVDAQLVRQWESGESDCPQSMLARFLEIVDFLDISTPAPICADDHRRISELHRAILSDVSGRTTGAGPGPEVVARLVQAYRLPRLAVAGRRNAGKTTLINSLLGQSILPTGHLPMTRAPTVLRHSRGFRHKDRGVCCIYFDADDIDSVLAGDDVAPGACGPIELLHLYASHGPHSAMDLPAPALSVVYVDAPILLACDLIDLPGLAESALDTRSANRMLQPGRHGPRTDALLLCSPLEQFCLDVDREAFALWTALRSDREPNIWLVATKARLTNAGIMKAAERAVDRLPWPPLLRQAHTSKRWFPFYQPTSSEVGDQAGPALRTCLAGHAMITGIVTDLGREVPQHFFRELKHARQMPEVGSAAATELKRIYISSYRRTLSAADRR